MSAWRGGRRSFLKGLTCGAGVLPFVPLLDAHAAAAPKRLVFFFSGNGTIYDSWLPRMEGNELKLSPILSPLESFKTRLLVIDGLCHKVILEKSDRSGHAAGMNTALTGRNNKITDPTHPLKSLATGVSVDQHIASRLGAQTKFRSLECGVGVEPWNPDTASLSYRGALQPILPETSPQRIFDRVFRDSFEDVAAVRRIRNEQTEERRRIFEAVSRELEALRRRSGRDDRLKLEGHLDAIRAIEHGLTTGLGAAAGNACSRPERGAPIDLWANDNIPALAKLQADLLVMALACDLTRVGTLQFGRGGAGHRFTWLGPEFNKDPPVIAVDTAKGFHALAHNETEYGSREKLVKIHAWYAGQLAYVLERLAAVPEAGGTMLDHTLVVWVNELGSGAKHTHDRVPWVLAGNADGYFKEGRLVSLPGEPHNRLLLSLCHAMGFEERTFGDPDYCERGPLSELTRRG